MGPTRPVSFQAKAAEALLNSPNFGFLADHHPLLVCYAALAERYVFDDPNTALIKLRQFGELLAEQVAAYHGLSSLIGANLATILDHLGKLRIVDRRTLDLFHGLRKAGNDAVHEHRGSASEALDQLRKAYDLGVWFHRSFGKDATFKPAAFHRPPAPTLEGRESKQEVDRLRQLERDLEEQRREYQRLEQELRNREVRIADLESKQKQLELERQELTRLRDQMMSERHYQASNEANPQDAIKRDIEDKLEGKFKELEDNHRRLEEDRQQLARYREQLVAFQQQVAKHNAQLQVELQAHTERLRQLEQENKKLQGDLEKTKQLPPEDPPPPPWRKWAFWAAACLLLTLLVGVVAWRLSGDSSPNSENGKPPPPLQTPPKQPPSVIGPIQAAKKVGESCTVEMRVLSAREVKGMLLLNSEKSYTKPTNFTIAVSGRVTEKLRKARQGPLAASFVGKRIRVTGTVTRYPPETGRPEIKVNELEQLQEIDSR